MREHGRAITNAEAATRAASLEKRVLDWFGDADAWIMPTSPVLPPRVGAFDHLDGEGVFREVAHVGAFTAPFNVSGQPAVSLPFTLSASGLPIGVQLVGRRGDDRRLLGLASALEEAIGSETSARRVDRSIVASV
jgi:amidase